MFDKQELQQLYRYCYSLTCDKDNAQDLLQSAVEKYIKKITVPETPMAYIKRIIHNQFIDDCRRKNIIMFENSDDDQVATDFDVRTLESLMIDDDLAEKVLLSLLPDEREIVYFWVIEGMSTSEISAQLEIPRGTVLSKIHRMRTRLVLQFDARSVDVAEDL